MKLTGWLVLLGVLATAIAIVLIAVLAGNNEEQIADRPTAEQLLGVLKDVRRDQRRACRVINKRFGAVAASLAGQRPSSVTTDYYRTHPDELAAAKANFDQIVAIFRARNCVKDYPVPTIEDVKQGGDAASTGHTPAPP